MLTPPRAFTQMIFRSSLLNRVFSNKFSKSNLIVVTATQRFSSNLFSSKQPNEIQACRLSTSSKLNGKVAQFTLADPGEGIREVVIKKWFVQLGTKVAQFDPICEVESDKATTIITSRFDGIVRKLHYEVDQTAIVGKPLVDIEQGEAAPTQQPAAAAAATNLKTPEASPTVAGASLSSAFTPGADSSSSGPGGRGTLATPAVRRMAHEQKVSLSDVRGSGKDGRILKEDVLRHVEELRAGKGKAPAESAAPATGPPAAPIAFAAPAAPKSAIPSATASAAKPVAQLEPPSPYSTLKPEQISALIGANRVEPLRGVRKSMYKSMTAALAIPSFGFMDEVELGALVARKAALRAQFAERGLKFSYMPFFVKAASLALRRFPVLNASIDEKAENIVFKASHNIGVAVDTPGGLVVPNVKHVQLLSVFELAAELARKIDAALAGRLSPLDVSGGTFTISNIGNVGGTYTMPVILPPEVAICGIGRMRQLPRFDAAGKVVPAQVLAVSWCADHRVVDGATVARFAQLWKQYIEAPDTMLLELR